jgi:hypothetical protein
MMRSPRLSPTRGDALLRLLSLDCTVVRDLVLFDLEVALLRDLFLGLRSLLLRKLRYVEVSPVTVLMGPPETTVDAPSIGLPTGPRWRII